MQFINKLIPNKSNQKAFTLIETLIVIIIIMVLISIVMGSITISRQTARDNKRVSDLKEIQLSLAIYYDVNRKYPNHGGENDVFFTLKDYGLSMIPLDPQTQAEYSYYIPSGVSNNIDYCLGAKIERDNIPSDHNNSCENLVPYPDINYWVKSQR